MRGKIENFDEAIQLKMRSIFLLFSGLPRRFAPRNDDLVSTQKQHHII
ncbi:hypothetical protein RFEPED_1103 [Rickettsia felis str. Pedreira]|uniref:Uncharacterized protein n=1 Tax=Rickettsia felis str. Pedreira TaxID=1359196 RepID=A0A0F3MSS5_RICFI|nr:hypothetical protein RFEPED_1103 [Rickettsia felis str. Pedreira]